MPARWLDPLHVVVLEDHGVRPTFEVLQSCGFWSEIYEREFTIPAGLRTDASSIPALLAPLVGSVSVGLRAGCLHDVLWRDPAVPTDVANAVFHEALIASNVDPHSAINMKLAVDLASPWRFGGNEPRERYTSTDPEGGGHNA